MFKTQPRKESADVVKAPSECIRQKIVALNMGIGLTVIGFQIQTIGATWNVPNNNDILFMAWDSFY